MKQTPRFFSLIGLLVITLVSIPGLTRAESVINLNPPATPIQVGAPVLSFARHLSVPRVTAPGTFTITDTVTNSGTASATHVLVRQELPLGMTTAGTTTLQQDFGTVDPNTTVSHTTTITVSEAVVAGRYANEATLSSDGQESILADAMLDISHPAVLGASTRLADTGLTNWPWAVLGGLLMAAGFVLRRLN